MDNDASVESLIICENHNFGSQVFMVGVILLFAACGGSGDPERVEDFDGIEHQRILWMENPSREAVVSWTTRSAGKTHQVHYDDKTRNGDIRAYRRKTAAFKNGAYSMVSEDHEWSEPGFYHHVHLTGLKPSTTYYFVIASDGKRSREFHFVTAPDDDRSFKLLFGGDSRIADPEPYDHNDRQRMNLRMAALVEGNPEILALVHGGDYCASAEWRHLDQWLADHEMVITTAGRMLPIIPARGNHDLEVGFEEMFTWPGRKTDYYYTISFSDQVAVVMLNTEISVGGDQREWLEGKLGGLRKNHRWMIAAHHRPSYPSVRSMQKGASQRAHWVPLFERHNIDLVYESHDHALKRTLPIRAGAPDPENGIVYLGDGGLGVPQRDPDSSRWWFEEPGFTEAAHHVHLLEFDESRIRVRAFGMDGEELDDFSLKPMATAVENVYLSGQVER